MATWQRVGENLVRYVPSGMIYLRVRIGAKEHRESLETTDLRIAKIKRASALEGAQSKAARPASTIVGDIEAEIARRIARPGLKAATARYYRQCLASMLQTLPEAVATIDWLRDKAETWWRAYAAASEPNRANFALSVLKRVAADCGVKILIGKRQAQRRANLSALPSREQMTAIVESIRAHPGKHADESADYVALLAWSGLRHGQARALLWSDVGDDWISVRGGTVGSKGAAARRLPINSHLREVIDRLRERAKGDKVLTIESPRNALNGACKRMGLPHLRIHDLRHWFATTCVESGVDVPTVSKWLGHKDGGALAMRVYGHLRDEHSLASVKKLD